MQSSLNFNFFMDSEFGKSRLRLTFTRSDEKGIEIGRLESSNWGKPRASVSATIHNRFLTSFCGLQNVQFDRGAEKPTKSDYSYRKNATFALLNIRS
jgi:hypothetical protein